MGGDDHVSIVENQGEGLIRKCKEKNIGFIAMKPLAGGAIEDAALALRYVCSNPDVTVVIPGMYDVKEMDENIAASEDDSPLSGEELEKAEAVRKSLGTMQLLPALYKGDQYFQLFPVPRIPGSVRPG